MPYLRMFHSSLSMLIVPPWLLFRCKDLRKDIDFQLSVLSLILLVVSFLLSYITYSSGFYLRDGSYGSMFSMVPNLVIIVYIFLYYNFFKTFLFIYDCRIDRFLEFYLYFVFILAIIFVSDISSYFRIRSFWTMSGNVIETTGLSLVHRFTSTLSDPNNISSLIVSVLAFLIFRGACSSRKKLIYVAITFFIVVGTMSSSGIFLYAFIVSVYLFMRLFSGDGKSNNLLKRVVISVLIVTVLSAVAICFYDSDIGKIVQERVSSNSMDSRYEIWKKILFLTKLYHRYFMGMVACLY